MTDSRRFNSTFKFKLIYIFRINDEDHKRCLKIGDATIQTNEFIEKLSPNSSLLNIAARQRIDKYTSTAGIVYELLHTELALYKVSDKNNQDYDKVLAFRDHKVHEVLRRSGIKCKFFETTKKQNEWFITDLSTAKKAIQCVKNEKSSLNQTEITYDRNPIILRPEQLDAIEKTITQFKNGNRMLWNAKMRFGKTLTALQVVKEMHFTKTMIITHRPVVSEGWFEDFNKIFYDSPNYHFGSKIKGKEIKELLDSNNPFVFFASIQDLRGSDTVGGNYNKNDEIFSVNWDFVVVDEAHEGTQTKLGKAVLDELVKPAGDYPTKVLELSGTPFNLLTNYEESNTYTWDYIMEQQAKRDWILNNYGDSNPYEDLPKLNIFTYHLEKVIRNFVEYEDKAFNFREFFRTWTGDKSRDFKVKPHDEEIGDFVHKNDVNSFLNLITAKSISSNYPFSTEEYREYFRHTLWILPGVKEAKALSGLLKKHPIFQNFSIVNVAGKGDEEIDTSDALKSVQSAITDFPDQTYTITLSCGRLTLGVSVPEWTAVFMLSGSYSTAASQYLQTIFRVQTPANINGRMKENCYVFDFAPDRTLKMICESIQLSPRKPTDQSGEKQLGMFLNFCPVIAVDSSGMQEYRVSNLLQELKRAYAERVVRNGFDDVKLYNDELLKLDDLALIEFEKLKRIVGSTNQSKKINDIEINVEGFSNEEYEQIEKAKNKNSREQTEEEKRLLEELKKKKENKLKAISILRGISIRIPLLVYGVDKDIGVDITVDNFADSDLIDDLSWNEFMPSGVDKGTFKKFAKYYDKDVFVAASRRIRFISKSADELEPTERVKKIANLFSTFKNPDKETVLTPWRVVNKHLSSCIGGYTFFDENQSFELAEPSYVDHGDVTKNTISNTEANILEINSKTGLYPLYVTYSLYRAHCSKSEDTALTFEKKLELWDLVVMNQVFVVCKTPMAKSITKRTLVGYRKAKVNTRYFENLINQLEQKSKLNLFIEKMPKGKSYWNKKEKSDDMKFNAIVGNPPYQLQGGSGGNNDSPIYQLFVNAVNLLDPDYSSIIIPARWTAAGRENLLKDFRTNMLSNTHIQKMFLHSSATDVFPNVEIKGGICYYLIDKSYSGLCHFTYLNNGDVLKMERKLNDFEVLIRDPIYSEIVKNVISVHTPKQYTDTLISNDTPFGISSNVNTSTKKAMSISTKKDAIHNIALYHIEKQKRKIEYISREEISKNDEDIDKYKVFIPGAGGSGNDSSVLGRPEFAPKNSVCSQSYLYAAFESEVEAKNFLTYINTKFFRVLVASIKITQSAPNRVYRFVPILDFLSSSKIPWNSSISEIDEYLFKYYSFSENQIEYVNKNIKYFE